MKPSPRSTSRTFRFPHISLLFIHSVLTPTSPATATSVSVSLPFQKLYKWVAQYVVFVFGFFHLAKGIWASLLLSHASVAWYFQLINSVPLYECTTFCLYTYQLLSIWIISRLWLLWIELNKHSYQSLCFTSLLLRFLRVEFMNLMKS